MTTAAPARPERAHPPGSPRIGAVGSPITGFVVLLLVYVGLSLFTSPEGHLSTDVGGKTATLAAMHERGDWSADIGYWAADVDPDGLAHPFANTMQTDEGWWVNTTSLPMVMAARPLWAIGGPRLVLVLPMMAAAGAAVVAGRLQRRLSPSSGTAAMWVVGVATPVTIYALDFWEHTIGVFFMALGTLFTLDAAAGDSTERDSGSGRRMLAAAGAGVAFAIGATMRQEALVYGFVAGLTLSVASLSSATGTVARRAGATVPSFVMAATAVLVLGAHSVAETLYYGEPLRSTRSLNAAASAGGGLSARLDDSFTVTLSPVNAIHPVATAFGLLLLAGLVWLAVAVRVGGDVRRPVVLLLAVGAVLALRVIRFGPSFIPGLVPTTPLAVSAVVLGWTARSNRLVLAMALLPVPIVYATQYVGGAVPQWAGRYLLTTGLLLVVVACAELPRQHLGVFRGLVAASFVVTATGVWFTSVRTNGVADDFNLVEQVGQGAVVVWYDPMKAREGGPDVLDQDWLSTVGGSEWEMVATVLDDRSVERFVYVDPVDGDTPILPGFEPSTDVGEWETGPILNSRLTVFERTSN